MNSLEAKKTLLAWRPGHGDLRDPQVAEALELARREPPLQQWLEKHTAFQRSVQQCFQQIPVPADLRDQILARVRNSKPVQPWQRPAWLAAAAAIVFLLGLAVWWFRPVPADSFQTFRDRTVRGVQRVYPAMGIVTNDMAQIRQYLSTNHAPSDYVLSPGLARLPATGAGLLSWQGQPVSMVCLDSGDQGTLFLFVLDRSAVKGGPPKAAEFVPISKLMTASWTQGEKAYLLAGAGGEAAIRRHLGQ